MKINFFKFCLLFICLQACNMIYSQDPPPANFELYLENFTSDTVRIKVYPISLIMNGYSQYNLIARRPLEAPSRVFNYNNGVRVDSGAKHFLIPAIPNGKEGFNFDGDFFGANPHYTATGSFGRGLYKILFIEERSTKVIDSVLYEQDAGINYDIWFQLVSSTAAYGGPDSVGLI
ncbi:MAG: hypothetical protein SGI89_12925 [bacterium]|nr:hypothetical protein [bacterium]